MKKLFLPILLVLFIIGCEKETVNIEDQTTDLEILNKGQSSKIDVCHQAQGNSTWHLINISENALPAHLAHGDVLLVDNDGDGYVEAENECVPGGDCDDNEATTYPGAEEICGDGVDNNCDGQVDEDCVALGDLRAGGVVFYIAPTPTDLDGDGVLDKGLVCALSDYGNLVVWGCFGADLPSLPNVPFNGGNPTGPGAEIGDGITNTNGILTDCPGAPAALAARSFGAEWFLPSAKELNEMYVNKATLEAVPGFSPFSIFNWSSTENYSLDAWLQRFSDGYQFGANKTNVLSVRAVRAF